jgi:hypothetical protein
MNNMRGAYKKRPRKAPPSLKFGGLAKRHMGTNAIPVDQQAVLSGMFNNPFKRHAMATLGGLKDWAGLRNRGFKGGGVGRIDDEGGNFSYHGHWYDRMKQA